MPRSVNTRVHEGAPGISEIKLPHERDESVGATAGVASGLIQQAHRDLARGLQDTDRGKEAGRVYKRLQSATPPVEDENADPVGPVSPGRARKRSK